MPKLNLKKIVKMIGADSAALMMPNDKDRYIYCYDSYNMPEEWVNIKNLYDENTPSSNEVVYKTDRPVIANLCRRKLKGYHIESVMILPIKRGKETIGMLELIHTQANKIFSGKDLYTAQNFLNS